MSYTQALGKVSIVGKGTWSNALAYDKLDVVKHNGGSYIALQNVPAGTLITDTAYWMSIVDKGEKGDTGSTGATGNGVASIAKTGTSGLVDTYTVTYTNGQTMTYTITNGADGVGIVSVEKTATSGNVDTYTILFTNGTTTTYPVTNGSVTSVDGMTGDVVLNNDKKANIDGYYDGLTSGTTEQVLSNVKETDKKPFVFRPSGGPLNIGDRKTVEAVGGSVVWNQLVQNGDFSNGSTGWTARQTGGFSVVSGEGVLEAKVTGANNTIYSAVSATSGHKYLVRAKLYIDANSSINYVRLGLSQSYNDSAYSIKYITTTKTEYATILTPQEECNRFTINIRPELGSSLTIGDKLYIDDVTIVDLTPTSSAIADRAYTMEQSTAGSGVAWLKSYGFFTKPYYAYTASPSIQSVKTSAHETVGLNQWDEEWEQGGISNATGENGTDSTRIRSKNYIPVFPSTVYSLTAPTIITAFWYDANKNYLTYETWGANATKTMPNNAAYMRFRVGSSTNPFTTYNNDICINLHGDRDGEYEAYHKNTYAFDSTKTLNGILKLDENYNIYADGDVYHNDETIDRNYEKRAYQSGDEELANAITDGTYTVVKLATPTTETANAFQQVMTVFPEGTERWIDAAYDAGDRDFEMPVGHITEYPINIRAKVEDAPNSPNENGDYLMRRHNGVNSYVRFTNELPTAPTTDGTYALKLTVTNGNAVYSWGSDT